MQPPSGFTQSDILYQSPLFYVARAVRDRDGQSVILKSLVNSHPSMVELARLQHEYDVLGSLEIPGVVRVYELLSVGNRYVLVSEDIGAVSVRSLLQEGPLSIEQFFAIAIPITETLASVHHETIIHKDIAPGNMVINQTTGQVMLIDFGMSTRLSREVPNFIQIKRVEGTLAYISPEQTGRMNRAIDFRADLYSLGASFYHMLTGQPPFLGTEPLEVIHSHLAKPPRSLLELQPEIPKALSQIVMFLLEKMPEKRYQSALALVEDLKRCRDAWFSFGTLDGYVSLQPHHVSDRFFLPDSLYGRDFERQTLLDAFSRVCRGNSEVVLVMGWAGMGKSALINELHKPIVKQRGFFVVGKFEQYRRTPYFGLLQALQALISDILLQEESVLLSWKERILGATAPNARLLTDVLPELKIIIGEQPLVSELGPAEAQNRFGHVITKFIHLFASSEHPLVLVLDDLQWADLDSLDILDRLTQKGQSSHLLIVCAFRDNEVDDNHPLTLALGRLKQAGTALHSISLRTLRRHDIASLLQDTLHSTFAETLQLAEFLLQKTGGNPFFLLQLLQQLYKSNFIEFHPKEGKWSWSAPEMEFVGVSENVVQLLIRKLNDLPDSTRAILPTAACLGSRFSLGQLALFVEQSILKVAPLLKPALEEGLIVSHGAHYRFVLEDRENYLSSEMEETFAAIEFSFGHDNIQTAAYSMLSEERLAEIHVTVGRQLLQSMDEAALEENLFEVVNHLNIASHLLTPDELKHLVLMNLQAGKKAMGATAYQAAADYFDAGLQWQQGDFWRDHYNLSYTLHLESARCHYLTGSFTQAEKMFDLLLEHVRSDVERADVYVVRMNLYLNIGKLPDVMTMGLEGLALLGISVSQDATPEQIHSELREIFRFVEGRDIASIGSLPLTEEPKTHTAMSLFYFLSIGAFLLGNNALWQLLIARMTRYALENGNTPQAAFSYCSLGMIVGPGMGDYDASYEWSQVGRQVAETSGNLAFQCVSRFVEGCFINHWKKPVGECFELLEQAFVEGLHAGNLIYCAYSQSGQVISAVCTGWPIDRITPLLVKAVQFAEQIKYDDISQYYYVTERWVAALQGETDSLSCMGVTQEDEDAFLLQLQEREFPLPLHLYYMLKAHLCLLDGRIEEAWETISISEDMLAASFGLLLIAQHCFYHALIVASRHPLLPASEQTDNMAILERDRKRLAVWSREAPMNFAHRSFLVEAEIAALQGQDLKAMSLYSKALDRALDGEFLHEAGLAAERAGNFHLRGERPHEAHGYFCDAHHAYMRWGAVAKLNSLSELDGHQRGGIFSTSESSLPTASSLVQDPMVRTTSLSSQSMGSSSNVLFDLSSLVKSMIAIAEDIGLESLLHTLIQILIENAGAERGFLLLPSSSGFVVEIGGAVEADEVKVVSYSSVPFSESELLCPSILRYVERTRNPVVLDDASSDSTYKNDNYILENEIHSLLCIPLLYDGKFTGILYLENNLAKGVFSEKCLDILSLLSTQAAIAIKNARSYQRLEHKLMEHEQAFHVAVGKLSLLQQQLMESQNQLVQSEKMASLGTLVAGVSHEINNPVAFTLGGALNLQQRFHELRDFFLAMAGEDAEKAVLELFEEKFAPIFSNLNSILEGAQRIKVIVGDLRTFSRIDGAAKERVQLSKNLRSTLSLVKAQFKHDISFHFDCQSDPEILCWPGQLNQVFMNMVVNACHAILKRKAADPTAPAGELRIKMSKQEGELVLSFFDNGCGMTENVKAKIFEPFFTTKGVGEGTGLGLSLSFGIVEKHNGRISVESTPNQGTIFKIFLPLSNER